jgi:hypothetical protein
LPSARHILDLWRSGDFWDVAFESRPWETSAVFGLLCGVGGGGIGVAIGETATAALGIAVVFAAAGLCYFRFWTGPRALQRRERARQKEQRRGTRKRKRKRS